MTRRTLLLPVLLLLAFVTAAVGPCEVECTYDTDCDAGQICSGNACVEFPHEMVAEPAQGTCDSDVECSRGELCFNRKCTDESLVPNPATCPAPPLADELVCNSWNQADCPCYAGLVAFHEKDVDGRLSCGGALNLLPEVKMQQNGCTLEAVDGALAGEAVGYGELRLRVRGFQNETPCSTTPDRWTNGREAVRLTCSQSCQLWMELLPPPPPERIVPDGSFDMGTPSDEALAIDRADEVPEHLTTVTCYYIDRFEISRGDYYSCMEQERCDEPSLPPSISIEDYFKDSNRLLPMTFVSYRAAAKFCEFKEKQLPTEAEWERAARASRWAMSTYPWGREKISGIEDCNRANFAACGGQPLPVSSGGSTDRAEGASYFDVVDLAGNVREWTRDFYRPTAYAEIAARSSSGPKGAVDPEILTPSESLGNVRVVRGGSFRTEVPDLTIPNDALRTSARDYLDEQSALDDLGFRCVRYKAGGRF